MTMYSHATILGVLLGQINSSLYTLCSYVNCIDFIWTTAIYRHFPALYVYKATFFISSLVGSNCLLMLCQNLPYIVNFRDSLTLWVGRALRQRRRPSGHLCRRLERQPYYDHLVDEVIEGSNSLGSFSSIRSGLVLFDRIHI